MDAGGGDPGLLRTGINLVKKWIKRTVAWSVGEDLYLSIPFTWGLVEGKKSAEIHRTLCGGRVFAGGPAVKLMGAPWAETPDDPGRDVLALHNPDATFTTRGCIRFCSFCAVPKIEGEFRELPSWKIAPVVCDNNLLAASRAHFERVIDSLKNLRDVDFNQGIDARLFTPWHADQIARLKKPMLRFSFDHVRTEAAVLDAIKLCGNKGLKNLGVYVLIGYNDTPADALHRLELIRSLGIRPNPMRYQPLDAVEKNRFVSPPWSDYELRRMTRYFNRLNWFSKVPYGDFVGRGG